MVEGVSRFVIEVGDKVYTFRPMKRLEDFLQRVKKATNVKASLMCQRSGMVLRNQLEYDLLKLSLLHDKRIILEFANQIQNPPKNNAQQKNVQYNVKQKNVQRKNVQQKNVQRKIPVIKKKQGNSQREKTADNRRYFATCHKQHHIQITDPYDFSIKEFSYDKIGLSSRLAWQDSHTLLITGGLTSPINFASFNILSKQFTQLPSLLTPRFWHESIQFDGKFWLIGGYEGYQLD